MNDLDADKAIAMIRATKYVDFTIFERIQN
jgi:hypothetical protein